MEQLSRRAPERIVLGVRPGHAPSGKPPVRIFLGTEASQFRPERVLAWSIERVRDPSRVYEIHLMKEIAGFDRREWTTGFTNYRFAIPEWAGREGRAIYNDEDQIYLSDPALLFDAEMDGHGFLAIAPRESSVMLIDCARMAGIWNVEAARRGTKKALLRLAVETPGLFGACDPHWNARDDEYREGRSHCLHYTTLHTQPWRPFPERFVYQDHPLAYLWHDLERGADAAGFQLFRRERPSAAFAALARERAGERCGAAPGRFEPELRELARSFGASRVLHHSPFAAPPAAGYDGVVATAGLEAVPEDDLPWVLDEIFAAAGRFVLVAVAAPAPPPEPNAVSVLTPAARWPEHLEAASRRRPEVHWELLVAHPGREPERHRGGRFAGDGPPQVWLVEDGPAAEEVDAARAVVERLGWPHATRRPAELAPPWPDLVIASGRRGADAARGIRNRSAGRTRVVLIGEEGGARAQDFDLAVTPVSAGFYPHPRRFETLGPLVPPAHPDLRAAADEAWRKRFESARAPRVALLAAGPDLALSRAAARRLGAEAVRIASESGGTLFALVGEELAAADALVAALGSAARVERCAGTRSLAWLAYLALADAFIVPGAAERALAEACATGRPVTIHPAGTLRRGPREAARRLVARLARAPRGNDRGTIRPQQGLERWCSRLVAEGHVLPPRDSGRLHAELARRGAARPLGAPDPAGGFRPLRETDRLAGRLRELLGFGPSGK
jgi:mitochondrial fission protein ELM1